MADGSDMRSILDMRAGPHGCAAPVRSRVAAVPPEVRQLVVLLVGMSIADIATTALALGWGATERSPGGAPVLAAVGLTGLVVLKVGALALVRWLYQAWPRVGRGVGWGLALMTSAAVTWNLHLLTAAFVESRA